MAYERKDILEKKELILQWIDEKRSKSFICHQLQCKPTTLDKYLKIMNIIYSGNKGSKGYLKPLKKRYIPLKEYIKREGATSYKIHKKLLKEGYKKHECEICGNTEWLGKPIPLELHHKDGEKTNNDLDNLMLICPNCHAQTENYRGKNTKTYTYYKYNNNIQQKQETNKIKKYCIDCNKQISPESLRCKGCEAKRRITSVPISRDEFKNLIRTKPFIKIGKMFNVSDNTIRKWCKKYNLPFKSKQIREYSDEDWDNL